MILSKTIESARNDVETSETGKTTHVISFDVGNG